MQPKKFFETIVYFKHQPLLLLNQEFNKSITYVPGRYDYEDEEHKEKCELFFRNVCKDDFWMSELSTKYDEINAGGVKMEVFKKFIRKTFDLLKNKRIGVPSQPICRDVVTNKIVSVSPIPYSKLTRPNTEIYVIYGLSFRHMEYMLRSFCVYKF